MSETKTASKAKKDSTDDVLKTAAKRYRTSLDRDRHNLTAAYEDLQFASGESQWPAEIRREREAETRPCMTFNFVPKFVRQVTGDIRQMRPAIKCVGVDDNADPDTAEAMQGVIRHIENRSDATDAYFAAIDSAVTAGIGHWRIDTEYADDNSDVLECRVNKVPDGIGVVWDGDATHPLRTDADFCFVPVDYSLSKFKSEFPDASASGYDDMGAFVSGLSNDFEGWTSGDTIRVCEYFVKRKEKVKDKRRPVTKVYRYLITAGEILEDAKEIPGSFIPIVPVIGEELRIGNIVKRRGLTRLMKDAARLYNYTVSTQAEVVSLQPKAPFMVTAKNVEDHLEIWNSANTKNYPFIPYTPDQDNGGQLPSRVQPAVSSQGLDDLLTRAEQDLKNITGIYDASLGARSNETSGKAILARQREGDTGTFVYVDNFTRAIKHTGRILVGMIPFVYDTSRVLRIIGEDGAVNEVKINTPVMEDGVARMMNDLTVGIYDVIVETGPSYATKRDEARDGMLQFLQSYPPAAQLMGDLVAKAQDWPMADKIAERLKFGLPPEIRALEARESNNPQLMPPQPGPNPQQQAEMAKLQVEQQRGEIDIEAAKIDLEAKRLAVEKARTELEKAQVQVMQAHAQTMGQMPQVMPEDPRIEAIAEQVGRLSQAVSLIMGAFAPPPQPPPDMGTNEMMQPPSPGGFFDSGDGQVPPA